MKLAVLAMTVCSVAVPFAFAASAGPTAVAPVTAIATPKDRAYPGEMRITADMSDLERRIVHVHESLSGIDGKTVLLYPQWLPGNHAPQGPIDRIAGLRISANGAPVAWARDPVEVYAFHVQASSANKSIDIDFDYLSPTSPKVGRLELSRDLLILEWNSVVLYPAGYFVRQIPVQASITLPANWQFASALEPMSATGSRTAFKQVNLETLIDSPVYAGRYSSRLDLDPSGNVPVHLDLFADTPELLAVKPEQLQVYRSLVQQAYKLFGAHHYAHYDFLYSLSDQVEQNGLEHHQSSEDGTDPTSFTEWDKTAYARDLLPHEFTHSWNGKFRRPADLWTANYNVPMQDSLLWVYEGQTQYWGQVLAARSGLWNKQEALDQLAPLAFEFIFGKRSVLRQLRDQAQQIVRKIHQAGERNHAGIGASARRKIRAHTPQVFLDLAAGAPRSAGAGHCSGHVSQAGRRGGRDGVSAAEEKLSGKFRDRVRFHEHDFETVRKRAVHAWRPDYRPRGSERRNR